MLEIPFAIQWTIPEDRLTPLKDSINDGCLFSTSIFNNTPDFEYYLGIYPNGDDEKRRGQTSITLEVDKTVDIKCTVTIDSANYSVFCEGTFDDDIFLAKTVCETKDFFDPEKKFIVGGECTVTACGTFKFKSENLSMIESGDQQKWDGVELGDRMWGKDETKDFTIIVEEKKIKIHKVVLDARSDVFSAMFNTKMKESIENKVEIPDFSFQVVEAGIKLIYNCNFESSLSVDDQMFLLQFFDKYDLPSLKKKIELLLINRISSTNVCRLTNCSIITNSQNLKAKCMKFMISAVATKTPFNDIEILDKEITMKILQNSFSHIVETDASVDDD